MMLKTTSEEGFGRSMIIESKETYSEDFEVLYPKLRKGEGTASIMYQKALEKEKKLKKKLLERKLREEKQL